MPWIESHSILIEHRKVREVAAILDIPAVYLIGHLHCLWHKVIELAEDGDITLWSEVDISYYSRWDKDPKVFYEALKNRFIDEKNGFKLIHDWLDYSRKYLYLKYHTNNPKLLKYIYKKYNYKGKPLGKPLGKPKGLLPNLTIPNLTIPNLTKDKGFDFEFIFNQYPNKDGKKQALKYFNSSVKTEADYILIQTALKNYLNSERVKNGYVKNASTWFNNWRDWIEPEKSKEDNRFDCLKNLKGG